ncbi:SDR family NAD(P)-dependent oxidoreductase [Sciscionella sediminilitoris]|uniref:SDR family NAD(P)-dependent oxidoreductase n=1 Tax=Sciscionella sediminilitoris TaxID=1445613 RepID=UPI0004DFB986|nr:SDR family NAD(P)-dependent oxidoreductase [Sciscionella sp. SE31]
MRLLDTALERLVLPGYSRIGYRLRARGWPRADPRPGALRGRTAMVTGANSGLGMATARGLAGLGATVIMVVRDRERGYAAARAIAAAVPGARLRVERCDLADLTDIARFAARCTGTLDVLVHNAGLLPAERTVTAQGHELALATHVLGPLLLTESLRPSLAGGRVVFVSSAGMYTQPLHDADPEYRTGRYRGAVAYARTKRMQAVLTAPLAERLSADRISVYCTHPGWADTPGVAESLPGFHGVLRPLLRDPDQGADTAIWLAATDPAPESGRFWHDRAQRPIDYRRGTRTGPDRARRFLDRCLGILGTARN